MNTILYTLITLDLHILQNFDGIHKASKKRRNCLFSMPSLRTFFGLSLLSLSFAQPPIPDPYSPPPGSPSCQREYQATPYYYHEECTQNTRTEQCTWSYDMDCRTNTACPWIYVIDCTQVISNQKCKWHYTMDCVATVPAPESCPWTYTIDCQ